ncbi:MAG: hypothetical protein NXH75_10815 [Halobacteriovoraceae bacterium]|nr:hypothetical protein [Halobacteriovoraceae bacterium]
MENSTLADIKKAKNFEEIMNLLKGENIALITEVLRSDKWSSQFIPFFVEHPNPLIRYEIATSSSVDSDTLEMFIKDSSMLVRQAAKNNLILRSKENSHV